MDKNSNKYWIKLLESNLSEFKVWIIIYVVICIFSGILYIYNCLNIGDLLIVITILSSILFFKIYETFYQFIVKIERIIENIEENKK